MWCVFVFFGLAFFVHFVLVLGLNLQMDVDSDDELRGHSNSVDDLKSVGAGGDCGVFHVLVCYFFGFFCSFLFVCFWLNVAADDGDAPATSGDDVSDGDDECEVCSRR